MLQNIFFRTFLVFSLLFFQLVQANTKTNTFHDNGNGSVSDIATGLMWQKRDDNVARLYAGAIANCDGLTLAGESDWRLPNIKELTSLVDYRVDDPAIDGSLFPGTNSARYWSVTSVESSSNEAWIVQFFTGRAEYISKVFAGETVNVYVRCVRSIR